MIEPDYFAKKKAELGFERVDQLEAIQRWCDKNFPGQIRAQRLHQGVLRLVTPSAGVAGDLRMRQVELLAVAQKLVDEPLKRLQISISSLN